MNKFLLTGLTLLTLGLGGGIAGIVLSRFLAPQSGFATVVGGFTLPVGLAAGMGSWLGFAVLGGLTKAVAVSIKHRSVKKSMEELDRIPPPGRFLLILCSVVAGGLGGLVTSHFSARSWVFTLACFVALGLGHGVAAFVLAGKGMFDNLLWEKEPF